MIGRHYWPHGSIDSAGVLIQTACALHRRGVHVEVLAPRFASSWPERITVREITVHRVAAAPRSDWLMGRYVRGLTAWLHHHGESFDVFYVDSIREEALAAIEVAKHLGIKVVLRCRGWGQFSDVAWWETGRSARRCAVAARSADAIIANSAVCERALLINGIDPGRIERVLQGFAAMPAWSAERRRQARLSLASANSDLHADPGALVVLCNAPMIRDGGVRLLVHAAHPLVSRYPNLRLWFIGDGPYRDSMYQQLRSDGVRASIAMPGSFCDSEDLFAAADVYLQSDEDGLEYFLPLAIASHLPVVAVDNASIRSLLDSGSPQTFTLQHGDSWREDPSAPTTNQPSSLIQWCESSTAKGVRMGLSNVLDDLLTSRKRAGQLRRILLRSRPHSETTEGYLGVIGRLVEQTPPTQRNHETEAVS